MSIYNGNDIPISLSNYVDAVHTVGINEGYAEPFILVPTSKAIAQFAVELVPSVEVKEVSVEDIQKISSERGTGALGSSNK